MGLEALDFEDVGLEALDFDDVCMRALYFNDVGIGTRVACAIAWCDQKHWANCSQTYTFEKMHRLADCAFFQNRSLANNSLA